MALGSRNRKQVGKQRKHAENLVGQLRRALDVLLDMAAEEDSTAFYIRRELDETLMAIMSEVVLGRKKK